MELLMIESEDLGNAILHYKAVAYKEKKLWRMRNTTVHFRFFLCPYFRNFSLPARVARHLPIYPRSLGTVANRSKSVKHGKHTGFVRLAQARETEYQLFVQWCIAIYLCLVLSI